MKNTPSKTVQRTRFARRWPETLGDQVMKNALLISIGTLLLPIVITGCYKFIDHSIGGVVWGNEVRKKWGDAAAVVAGIPFLVIGFTIVINVFMGVTAAMGEMDYHAI